MCVNQMKSQFLLLKTLYLHREEISEIQSQKLHMYTYSLHKPKFHDLVLLHLLVEKS